MMNKAVFVLVLGTAIITAGCGVLSASPMQDTPQIAQAITNVDGLARLESAAGALDFQVTSGLSGERLPGIRLSLAVFGQTRLLLAEDPTGYHLPLAVPLAGESTVRRLIMPPKTGQGYNIVTAAGPLNMSDLEPLGSLTETDIRSRLTAGPDEAVLIYLYNPVRPLALTGAALEAFGTPFENVTVLRAAGEPPDAILALLMVGMNKEAYPTWSNRVVDRYLAGRIGQAPSTDLRADLTFAWSYPVFDVFPPEPVLKAGQEEWLTLRVTWRSANPDPPPPWSFVVSSDSPAVIVEPQSFSMGPSDPARDITIRIDRSGLAVGEYSAHIFIQPYSDAFGLIEQAVERELAFSVAQALPTPTGGPRTALSYTPSNPREGDLLTITSSGFEPGEAVLVELIGPERSIRDALPTADQSGSFTYQIDLDNVPAGSYVVRLSGSRSGLVAEDTLTVGPGVADAVVRTNELNLRTGPGYDYPVLEVLVRGDELTVIGTNADDSWIEVITKTGVQGWVVTDLVDLRIDLATVPWNPNVPPP